MAEAMRIAERTVGDVTILELDGRLVLEEGDISLRDCINNLLAQHRVKIVLDMKSVTYMDSAGIGMLVSKYLSAFRKGGTVKLLHLTNRSDHLLEITRLSSVFEIFESEDDAIRSFGVQPA